MSKSRKDVFADGPALVEGGRAILFSPDKPTGTSGWVSKFGGVGTVAVSAQSPENICEMISYHREIAGPDRPLFINIMAAAYKMEEQIRAAFATGMIDGGAQGAGVTKTAPELFSEYGMPFYPIIKDARQTEWFRKKFQPAGLVFEDGVHAGGHLGDPKVSLFDSDKSLEQVVEAAEGLPVIAAGGITPNRVEELIERGASAVQVATPFILTPENGTPPAVTELYKKATSTDVVLIDSAAGVLGKGQMKGRAIRNGLTDLIQSGFPMPPEYFGYKCNHCLKSCVCRDSSFTQSFCIRASLLIAKIPDVGERTFEELLADPKSNLNTGLYFTGSEVGYWNSTMPVEQLVGLYMAELRSAKVMAIWQGRH